MPEEGDFVVGSVVSQASLLRRHNLNLRGNGTVLGDNVADAREDEREDQYARMAANLAPQRNYEVSEILNENSDYNRMDAPGSRFNYCWNAATQEEKDDVLQARQETADADKAVEQSAASANTGMPSTESVIRAEETKTDQAIKEAHIVEAHGKPADSQQAAGDLGKLTANAANLAQTKHEIATARTEEEKWAIFKRNQPERAAEIERKFHKHVPTSVIDETVQNSEPSVQKAIGSEPLPGKGITAAVSPRTDFKEVVDPPAAKGPSPSAPPSPAAQPQKTLTAL